MTSNTSFETTSEYRGNKLGSSVKAEWATSEIAVDHIDSATEKAMKFNGVWIPNSMIVSLKWAESTGSKSLRFIVIPSWFANKNNL